MLRIPDWLSYEVGHKLERLRDGYRRLHVLDSINENPRIVASIAICSVLVLIVTLWLARRPDSAQQHEWGKKAWFYDLNTGGLFTAGGRETGPVEAPSGPLPDGADAGLRAHVYSYVLDPNESERFVGFLEKPDPQAGRARRSVDQGNLQEWMRGKLIRKIDDDGWVPATGRQGQGILQELGSPNELGQTAIYCVPD